MQKIYTNTDITQAQSNYDASKMALEMSNATYYRLMKNFDYSRRLLKEARLGFERSLEVSSRYMKNRALGLLCTSNGQWLPEAMIEWIADIDLDTDTDTGAPIGTATCTGTEYIDIDIEKEIRIERCLSLDYTFLLDLSTLKMM